MTAGTAYFSDCGEYRYCLTRRWAPGPVVCWVMLNPSTADAMQDDPTIRRCIAFSKRDGFGALSVVNLYARRCTQPVHLKDPGDPVGPMNDVSIRRSFGVALKVVAAWGAHPGTDARVDAVRGLASSSGLALFCLGTTKSGAPRHPLYVKGDAELVRWQP